MLLKNGLRDKHQAMSKDPLEFRQRSHPLENMSMCLIFDVLTIFPPPLSSGAFSINYDDYLSFSCLLRGTLHFNT